MNPQHFLPNGAGLLVKVGQETEGLSHNLYVVAQDGALRAGRRTTDARLLSFCGPQARDLDKKLNPFLVVLNAEMAFRRFCRRPHSLCDEYTELIDLTITLGDKIYFQPIIDEIELEIEDNRRTYIKAPDGDVEMRDVDEFGAKASDDKDKTITRKDAARSSRMRQVVDRPGPDASPEKVVDYYRYLMSGYGMTTRCLHLWSHVLALDNELTPDDEDLLAELDSKSDCSEEEEDSGDGTFALSCFVMLGRPFFPR